MSDLLSEAATKEGLPRSAFAYAPTSDPSTWKLPFRKANGSIDTDRLPMAAAAVSSGGFRGQKADIPASALPMVKAKLRRAYREWKGKDAPMPDSIKESNAVLEEATVLLDRAGENGTVVYCPSCGDTLVIPAWGGAFTSQMRNKQAPAPVEYAEAHENHAEAIKLGKIQDLIDLIEAGRRNSSKDQTLIQQLYDLAKQLGAKDPEKEETPEPVEEPVAQPARIEESIKVEEDAVPEEIRFSESGMPGEVIFLREAAPIFDSEKHEIWITPIKPGWGNAKDGYYYPKKTLKEAVKAGVFNNRKMYANHPRLSDEAELPERSVWDWVSTLKETVWDEDKDWPRSRVRVYDDRFWDRAEKAPDEIAFSILGNGRAVRGMVESRTGRIVEELTSLRSVDWVTEAGAGGQIAFAESAHEEFEMDLSKLTAEQLKDARPDLYEELTKSAQVAESDEPEAPASEPAESKTEASAEEPEASKAEAEDTEKEKPAEELPENESNAEPAAVAAAVNTPALNADVKTIERVEKVEAETTEKVEESDAFKTLAAQVEQLQRALQEKELKEAIASNKSETAAFVESTIRESTLPQVSKDFVKSRFENATAGEGMLFASQDALKAELEREISQQAKIVEELTRTTPIVRGLGSSPETPENAVRESVNNRLADRWGMDTMPSKQLSGVISEGTNSVSLTPATTVEDDGDESTATVSEAAQGVQDRLAARLLN